MLENRIIIHVAKLFSTDTGRSFSVVAKLRTDAVMLRFEISQEVSRHPFHVVSRHGYHTQRERLWRILVRAKFFRHVQCRLLTSRIVPVRLSFDWYETL